MNDITEELLEKHMDQDSYFIVAAQESAPSKETLVEAGSQLGCIFPEEYLAHATSAYGGVYIEVKEDIWPRAKAHDAGPFWSFLYGLYVFNLTPDIPDFMNIKTCAEQFRKETGHSIVPFLKVIGDANVYCFDDSGHVVRWDHDSNEIAPENKSFFEVLDFELGELRERKERKVAGEA